MLRPRVDGTSFHKTTKTEKAKQLVRSVVQGSHFALGSQILHSTQLASHNGASVRTSTPPTTLEDHFNSPPRGPAKPLRSFHYPLSRYASQCTCSTRHPEARVMCMLNSRCFSYQIQLFDHGCGTSGKYSLARLGSPIPSSSGLASPAPRPPPFQVHCRHRHNVSCTYVGH